jgi:TetR/AcrR family transcriptional regulator, transcriptional repressor for nem operon
VSDHRHHVDDRADPALALLAALRGGLLLGEIQRDTRPLEVALDTVIERIQSLVAMV